MNYLTQSAGYDRPPSLLARILHAIGQAAVIILIFSWALTVACWDTIVGGKDEQDQIGK
jgi:hypothetical protein